MKKSFLILFLFACKSLPVVAEIKGSYKLFNQDSIIVNFPNDFKGKRMLIGFIYTNCPDICPIITENMKKVQENLKDNNVLFILISFDPERDKPSVLRKYGEIRDLDFSKWVLLTGNEYENLIKEFDVIAIKEPSQGNTYFITHTDRISLVDSKGRIRKHYKGSKLNENEVLNDLRKIR